MKRFPDKLQSKLQNRQAESSLRQLGNTSAAVDFASNDYLGFSKSEFIFEQTHQLLSDKNLKINGATGSRLLSGNHVLYAETEMFLTNFHDSESALIFNSGYDANVGFFSCVPQKGDFILYDELCHASIRDGIRLSQAKSYKFSHNDYEALETLANRFQSDDSEIYVVTESVFSMDGDCPNVEELVRITQKFNCLLVIDEAHALGVFGDSGEGLVQQMTLQDHTFARIMTFGKGLGCHGAAILGSQNLKDYLVNFARSFIYTTGLSPHAVANILVAYKQLQSNVDARRLLQDNISHFNQQKMQLGLKTLFVYSKSAVQSAIIPGNQKVKNIAAVLQQQGFDIKAILSPTVPEGQERLRICLHSFNTQAEIDQLLQSLQQQLF